ncbi:transposase, IS481 family [Methylomarinovum caldicuralii]|uniref:Transposase, IS481 family n=1 Tax=Methylomarinovum caldicuralii TaxID=438856 RepID=A0AAU9CWI5_9GAMM|nr:IS481 family transposase [Methylomarinovum caldicuralii]BCX82342.1 transposase, IS481 family [Methylomarinovum caldicuralii]
MVIRLHKKARTTPEIRREIQNSDLPATVLARKYGVHRHTIRKWRQRDSVEDASHRPHRIHATLTPQQEAIVVCLRETLLLPLDDLLAVVHRFIHPKMSRSALDRLLRRHGVSNLKELIAAKEGENAPAKAKKKGFKDYEPGFVHIDIKYLPKMPDETRGRYLFVAIDRASRRVYLEIHPTKEAQVAAAFLDRLIAKAPLKITKVLTDNGKDKSAGSGFGPRSGPRRGEPQGWGEQFTDRFWATGEREPTGRHLFDPACQRHGIEHRLIPPKHPQTNGMVERFNGRIAEILKTTRFRSSQDLERTLMQYASVYNHQIPQKALGHISPVQALKDWQKKRPELFKKRVYNLTGLDTQ